MNAEHNASHCIIVTPGANGPEVWIHPDALNLLQQAGLEFLFLGADRRRARILSEGEWEVLKGEAGC